VSAALKLYVKSWCPWCISATHYLKKRSYTFETIDVLRDAAAYDEMIRVSGQRYTPTLVVHDKVLADFGTDELEAFLNEHRIQP
jgi:glutaredoxin